MLEKLRLAVPRSSYNEGMFKTGLLLDVENFWAFGDFGMEEEYRLKDKADSDVEDLDNAPHGFEYSYNEFFHSCLLQSIFCSGRLLLSLNKRVSDCIPSVPAFPDRS